MIPSRTFSVIGALFVEFFTIHVHCANLHCASLNIVVYDVIMRSLVTSSGLKTYDIGGVGFF